MICRFHFSEQRAGLCEFLRELVTKITNRSVAVALAYFFCHRLFFACVVLDRCRFSQMLEPIYDDLADKVSKELSVSSFETTLLCLFVCLFCTNLVIKIINIIILF